MGPRDHDHENIGMAVHFLKTCRDWIALSSGAPHSNQMRPNFANLTSLWSLQFICRSSGKKSWKDLI